MNLGFIAWISFVIILRSSTYALVMHVIEDVVKWYPRSSFSNHLRSDSRNMGLRCATMGGRPKSNLGVRVKG